MDRTPSSLSIGQLNLQGSEVATSELPVIAAERNLDLVLVQEQYVNSGLTGLLQCGSAPKAGIMVRNDRIALTLLHNLSTEHCTVVHADYQGFGIYIVSAYFQYSHDIVRHLEHLSYVMDRLAGSPVLIGMDSNAHSPLWFCERRQYSGRGPDTEHRKTQMESFIFSRGLLIHNEQGQPPTFCGPNGSSNVDLTLSTRGVAIKEWRVHEGASVSDHQLITFQMCSSGTARQSDREPDVRIAFRERGVNWAYFRSTLSARMGKLDARQSANDLAKQYSELLTRTATRCLGYRRDREFGGYEWWTPELDRLRRTVNRARRSWQNSRRHNSKGDDVLREALHEARHEYKLAMKEAEVKHFRQVAETGNDDPWGLAYRAATGRTRPPRNVLHGGKLVEGYANDTGTAMHDLLYSLCPDDSTATDSEYHRTVRVAAAFPPSGGDSDAPGRATVELIIKNLPNTSPGLDGITRKIIQNAWKASSCEMLLMYAACISQGVFPDIWKIGSLIVLPKGNDKPLTDPKAYRPITLLPILGKILERIIIACAPCLYRGVSDDQHGFVKGRSTVTALRTVFERVDNSTHKYVQLVFLDISGAFDNAWWPMILLKAKAAGVSPNIYRILVSYFSGRRIGLSIGSRTLWKTSTMGCPQGSVLGPTLWNLLLDDLLRLPKPDGVTVVAYADDVTLVIEASSRASIEHKCSTVLHSVSEWGTRNRLTFSPAKSQTMTIKGRFKRAPTIKLDGASVASVSTAKLLGVYIDDARSYASHASFMGEKAASSFGKVSRVSASSWGVKYRALRFLYYGTYVAILTYAATIWYRRSQLYVVQSAVLRSQRPALVLLTKAYRSCSTAALPVLAGVLPADLEVVRAGRVQEECEGLTGGERKKKKTEILSDVVSVWQTRWAASGNGRELYSFFPDIASRLVRRWVEPDYVTSQILTGHGCFRGRLYGMTLCDTPSCYCGHDSETRDHILWECDLYREERNSMLDGIERTKVGPVYHEDLTATENNFSHLRMFAHSWHKRRTEMT